MKIKLFLFLLILIIPKVKALELSPDAKISLITCTPGNEIYSYFGHSAIRINDPKSGFDFVFNYGVFSFNNPLVFAWHFTKGETDYLLYGYRMEAFMQEYYQEKRSVYEQVLNITQSEKQVLFDALNENAKAENRVYRYRHFSNNCSTKVRDQFEKCVSNQLKYDNSKDSTLTYRNLVDRYVPGNTWSGFGIKIGLGMATDVKMTFSQKMFLPDYLSDDLAHAKVFRNGVAESFVMPRTTLFEAKSVMEGFSLTSPAIIVNLFLLVIIGLTYFEIKKGKRNFALDFVVFFSFGLAGLLLTFLCFISELEGTGWNFNLMWALPTHLIFAFLWLSPKQRPRLGWYLKLTTGIIAIFPAIVVFSSQTFHGLVLSLCLIMLLRTGRDFLAQKITVR